MTEITIFKNEQFGEIRTMTDEQGETFFVGIDVAKALGYKNPSNALQVHVDKEDKTSYLIQVSGTKYEAKTIFLNESGLQLTKVRIEKTGNMVSTWKNDPSLRFSTVVDDGGKMMMGRLRGAKSPFVFFQEDFLRIIWWFRKK